MKYGQVFVPQASKTFLSKELSDVACELVSDSVRRYVSRNIYAAVRLKTLPFILVMKIKTERGEWNV